MLKRLLIINIMLLVSFNNLFARNHETFSKMRGELKTLKKQNKTEELKEKYREAIQATTEANNTYWKFYFHKDFSWFYYGQDNYIKRAEQLDATLKCLDTLLKNDHRKLRWQWEELLNMGSLEITYTTQYKLTAGLKLHRQLVNKLNAFVGKFEGREFNVFDDKSTRRLPSQYRSLISRTIWREAFYLSKQGKVQQAITLLNRFVEQSTNLNDMTSQERNYYLKLLNSLVLETNFLGYKKRALSYNKKILSCPFITKHPHAYNTARYNRVYFTVKFYGPDDKYIQQAYDVHKQLCELSATKKDASSKKQLFKILSLIDTDLAKTEMMQEVIDAVEFQGDVHEKQYSRRDLAMEKINRGETDGLEEEFLDLLRSCRKQSNKVGEPTLYREYAGLLEKLGRFEEAVTVMQSAIDMTESFGWMLHLPRLYNQQARFYIALNRFDEAQQCWDRIEDIMNTTTDFPAIRRFGTMVYKLKFLIANGDKNGAMALFSQIKQLLKNSEFNAFQQRIFTQTDWISEIEKAKVPVKQIELMNNVSIQPASVRTAVAKDETPFTTFSLINDGDIVQGELTIIGAKAHIEKVEGENRYLNVVITELSGQTKQSLTLLDEEQLPIILSYDGDFENKGEVFLHWQTAESDPIQAYWLIENDDEPSDIAVTNSNLAWSNPYYAIPLYHNVINRNEEAKITDFAVKSTVPCRVELYDAATGELLGIDNAANSSFADQGDVLNVDQNGSDFPDIKIDSLATVLLLVYPVAEEESDIKEFSLELKLKVGGEWQSCAQNRIILSKDD